MSVDHIGENENYETKIETSLSEAKDVILNTEFLDAVEANELTDKQWQEFVIQRTLITSNFEKLLLSGMRKALELKSPTIKRLIQKKLREEDSKSFGRFLISVDHDRTHSKMRKNFRKGFGIDESTIYLHNASQAVKNYRTNIEEIMSEPPLVVIGAILALLHTSTEEFGRILIGLNSKFSQLPYIHREYLEEHIRQDSSYYCPQLHKRILGHLDIFSKSPEIDAIAVRIGIKKVTEVKIQFYEAMKHDKETEVRSIGIRERIHTLVGGHRPPLDDN